MRIPIDAVGVCENCGKAICRVTGFSGAKIWTHNGSGSGFCADSRTWWQKLLLYKEKIMTATPKEGQM